MRNKQIFTIDPSAPYHTIDLHIKDALKYKIHAYEPGTEEHAKMVSEAIDNLKKLLKIPHNYQVIFMNSQLVVYQILKEVFSRKKSLFLLTGRRSKLMTDHVSTPKKGISYEHNINGKIDLNKLESIHEINSVFLSYNEPDTGYRFPEENILEIKKSLPKSAFIHIDAGEAIPSVDFDFKQADSVTFPAHVGFGLPMGILVWVLKPDAYEHIRDFEKAEHNHPWYIDAREYLNLLDIFLLGNVAQDMIHRGIKQIRNECIYKSTIIYDALEKSETFNPGISDENYRSVVTIIAETEVNALVIREKFSAMGLMISVGEGDKRFNQIRIGNFPAHSKEQIEMLVDLLLNPDGF
ncbi:aminotransferase class V-fold PLP-dependent enzyme [Bacteroidota bacterium]